MFRHVHHETKDRLFGIGVTESLFWGPKGGGGQTFIWRGGGARGRRPNEGCTIKSQMGVGGGGRSYSTALWSAVVFVSGGL